jgi:hypothetical protein
MVRAENLGYVNHVEPVSPGPSVCKVALQRLFDGAEGHFIPGNFISANRRASMVSKPGSELVTEQARSVKQVDLPDTGNVEQREKVLHFNLGSSFFIGFARRLLRPSSRRAP